MCRILAVVPVPERIHLICMVYTMLFFKKKSGHARGQEQIQHCEWRRRDGRKNVASGYQ
jgi:hypothetical protein